MQMKLTIAALATLLSSVLATVYINNPVADTVWPHDGSPIEITWISSDDSLLTGTVIVQLMDGEDANNLLPKSVSFTPPASLPGSSNYAVLITSSVDGPHYSHTFTAGDASITEPFSNSAKPSKTSASSSSTKESSTKESSTKETASASDDEKSEKSSDDEDAESESDEPESDTESESESESRDHDSSSSGAGRSQVAIGGFVGAAAIVAALF
ncbi:hypothetical protein GGF39_001852 [Coemansia sp. RSA 1721]|nr:hypothetical protein GGF39_001852 [Coemansia sp. RSA 1721]